MKLLTRSILAAIVVATLSFAASAQTVEKKSLTIEGAKKVIAAAVAYAKKNNAPGGVIAFVDDGGNLMALERLDGTFAAGANISVGKARTAVLFKRPTKVFEDVIKNGRTSMVALPDAFFTPLKGGIPIAVDGQIVGGVGVSGAASAQQDEELAIAGAAALNADDKTSKKGSNVLFFDSNQVERRRFRKVRFCLMELTATTWSIRANANNPDWRKFMQTTLTSFTLSKARRRL